VAIIIGDTIRLKATFYNYSGALADPDSVTAKIYSHIGQILLATGAATKESTGVYYYDYTVPADVPGLIVYEFSGMMDGTPTAGRATFEKVWVR
jgi:hypothetical protein